MICVIKCIHNFEFAKVDNYLEKQNVFLILLSLQRFR